MMVVKALYRFFRSTKLALLLLLIIAFSSLLATFIPQRNEPSFYYKNYPPFFASAILFTHYQAFFRSLVFLLPSALFFVNLFVCSIDRIITRAGRKTPRRFGPDLIHIGILILMIGGFISLFGKREGSVFLSPGEWVELPNDHKLILISFRRTTYDDGRPKEFISNVDIFKQNRKLASYAIEVNRPLKIGRIRVYQESYSIDSSVVLQHEDKPFIVKVDSGFEHGDSFYFLRTVREEPKGTDRRSEEADQIQNQAPKASAVFERYRDNTLVNRYTVGVSDDLADFSVQEIIIRESTGLRFVEDRGVIPVFISFIIIGSGLFLTFIQKLGDKKP